MRVKRVDKLSLILLQHDTIDYEFNYFKKLF